MFMKRPGKFGTLLLSIYLVGVGAAPLLQVSSPPIYAILHFVAIGAGVLIWLDR